ncbi:uncharacterized protein LOC134214354 [Armigeres subalbatus]|uniref:uncharacterized protein LOC134214354 n=1 Tax=Armigeres subalbatus TaxID=124917 RepID=UPI002ED10C44
MSKNHNYLQSAQNGDLSAVKFYLESCSDEVDVNYQDTKLRSALHRAALSTRNSHQMVKILIEGGIDCGLSNDENHTAAEMARHLGRGDLMLLMLEWEFRGVPKREIFYQLLRRNSMELVCVYAVNWKLPHDEAIRLTEEAYEALRMKGVQLEEQTRFEVLQELVKYYGANPTACRDIQDIVMGTDELLEYIDFVLQNTDENNLNETSGEVLMAMREIVKQVFLGKSRYDEAMMEVQHCLCCFIDICDGFEGAEDFSLIINKKLVLCFLCFAAKQLRSGAGRLSSRDRKVRKLLSKTFTLLKEWNSILKIVFYLTEACKLDLKSMNDKIMKQLFMDRCIQVVGEAIKSTQFSPNLSRRMIKAFEFMVSGKTASCYRSFREFHSHGYSVTKYLYEKENDFKSYIVLQENFKTTLTFFEHVKSMMVITLQKRCVGLLYKLKTVKQIRSLAMFINDRLINSSVDPDTLQFFYSEKNVMKLIGNLKCQLMGDSNTSNDLTEMEQLLKSHFEDMYKLGMKHLHMGQSFKTCFQAAKACRNTTDLRSMLKVYLAQPGIKSAIDFFAGQRRSIGIQFRVLANTIVERYGDRNDQKILQTAFQLLCLLDCESVNGLDNLHLKRTNCASEGYVEKVLRESGAYEHYKEIPPEIRRKLRKNVETNVFDVKTRLAILALPDNPKLCAYRKAQEDEFQAAFDRKVATLKSLLINSAHPTGRMYEHQITAYSLSMIAIQQALLEICEICLGVKAMQRNLHHLDHRIPIVSGKNLRDGLAHDMTMYNVISESWAHYFCNAVYYGTLSLKLYDSKDWPNPVIYKQQGSKKLCDKLRWFEMQRRLYEHLKDMESLEIGPNKIDSPDILGTIRETKADFTFHNNNALYQALRHNVQTFVDHIDGERFSKNAQYLIHASSSSLIPRKTPNRMSFHEKVQTLLRTTLTVGDFGLYRTISQKYNAAIAYDAAFKLNPHVLDHLNNLNLTLTSQMLLDCITCGNLASFEWLIEKLEPETISSCSPLQKALCHAQLEMAKSLLEIVTPNQDDAELAVIFEFNEILPRILPHVKDLNLLYLYAVTSGNLEAIKIMERSYRVRIDDDILHQIAIYNRTSILEHFLQDDEWRKRLCDSNERDQTPLDIFAATGNYLAVKMIAQHTDNVASAIRSAAANNRNRIVKFLLRCNTSLLSDLLLDLIGIAIQNNNNTLLKYLLSTQSVKENLNLADQFLAAIQYRNFDALKIILEYDPLSAQTFNPNRHYCAHHIAVQALNQCTKKNIKNHSERIFNLLKTLNVDPCYKGNDGITPLHMAVTLCNLYLVRQLSLLGPSAINEPDAIGRTPLICALISGNLPIVRHLVEQGAHVEDLGTFRHSMAFNAPPITHFLDKNIECLEYAVRTLHLDLELRDSFGCTLLHELCRADNAVFVEFLLEQCQAKMDVRNHNGETVLHHAIRNNSVAVLDYLLKRGDRSSLLEQVNRQGETALMLAIATPGRMPMAVKLVMAGASKDQLLKMIAGKCVAAMQHLKQ